MTSGRQPRGSRAAISVSPIDDEQASTRPRHAPAPRRAGVPAWSRSDRARGARAPRSPSTTRRSNRDPRGRVAASTALMRFPLCASAMWPPRKRDEDRLRVVERGRAGGAVARVADRDRALERARRRRPRSLRTRAPSCATRAPTPSPSTRNDARRLLPPMLQRVQAEVRQRCRARMTADSEDSAHAIRLAPPTTPGSPVIGRRGDRRHHRRNRPVVRRRQVGRPVLRTVCVPTRDRRTPRRRRPPCRSRAPARRAVAAIASTAAGSGVETTTRPCASPKSSARRGSADQRPRSTVAPSGASSSITQHSASATARPPSLQSCAEAHRAVGRSPRAAPRSAARSAFEVAGRRRAGHVTVDPAQVLARAQFVGVARRAGRSRRPGA